MIIEIIAILSAILGLVFFAIERKKNKALEVLLNQSNEFAGKREYLKFKLIDPLLLPDELIFTIEDHFEINSFNDEIVVILKQALFDLRQELQKLEEIVRQCQEQSRYIDFKVKEIVTQLFNRNEHLEDDQALLVIGEYKKLEIKKLMGIIDEYNTNFYDNEKSHYTKFFKENFGKHGLSDEQIEATISDDAVNLINAAAGSGKTSVIVAKVNHLIENKNVKPSEILLLTFSRKAKDEMLERIAQSFTSIESLNFNEDVIGHDQLNICTLHSYARTVVKNHQGGVPHIAFSDKKKGAIEFKNAVAKWIIEYFGTSEGAEVIKIFLKDYISDGKSLFEYQNYEEYKKALRANGAFTTPLIPNRFKLKTSSATMLTIKGEYVRSFEEKKIADFLYLSGINYEYERASETEPNYKCDFYLTDHHIYIEHFGIDENGDVPPFFESSRKGRTARESYWEGIEWKRKFHESHQNKYFETYSYWFRNKQFEGKITADLKNFSVPIRHGFRFNLSNGIINFFTQIFTKALNLYFLSGKNMPQIKADIQHEENSFLRKRNELVFAIFDSLLEQYNDYLTSNRKTDFSKIIKDATVLIESGQVKQSFKYIIVDEFQDTANLCMDLLDAIWKASAFSKFYFVGDDWQSIYGFNGSDVTLMCDISNRYSEVRTVDLTTNYRSLSNIVDLGKEFVQRNPFQLKKETTSFRGKSTKSNSIKFLSINQLQDELLGISAKLTLQNATENKSLLFLGRANADLLNTPDFELPLNLVSWGNSEDKAKKIAHLTVHGSKGLEADIICLLPSPSVGFPSQIKDDPFIKYIMNKRDDFPFSEERRLFYVAVTRAKDFLYFVYDRSLSNKTTLFLDECQDIIRKNGWGEVADLGRLTNDQAVDLTRFRSRASAIKLYSPFCKVLKKFDDGNLLAEYSNAEGLIRKIVIYENSNQFTFTKGTNQNEFSESKRAFNIYDLVKDLKGQGDSNELQVEMFSRLAPIMNISD